jgi:regulator of cell morphogenesis and NO signaling
MDLSNKTVRDMALEIPGATRVFEKMGIDYCRGGKRPLAGACAAAGVELSEVKRALQRATASPEQGEEPKFHLATPAELINQIAEKHHSFARLEPAPANAESLALIWAKAPNL